ncbi:hypothetical protein [Streptomyces sp. NPDC088350]|uniref:hypothetical protein n=1 Tax=Streptomyces sp. NPDC088350 TaxID=3365854 RepID=UPI0037F172CA
MDLRDPASAGPRIGIAAGCTADPILPCLGAALAGTPGCPMFHVSPYDQIVRACLDPGSGPAGAGLDVLVAAHRLDELRDGAGTGGLLDVGCPGPRLHHRP